LAADKFIRRFLLHVLPTSYTRIRHFGFLSNYNRKQNIDCIKKILGISDNTGEVMEQSLEELMLKLTGKDILKCLRCGVGKMTVCYLIPGSLWGWVETLIGLK
jgi:hypothetical protein